MFVSLPSCAWRRIYFNSSIGGSKSLQGDPQDLWRSCTQVGWLRVCCVGTVAFLRPGWAWSLPDRVPLPCLTPVSHEYRVPLLLWACYTADCLLVGAVAQEEYRRKAQQAYEERSRLEAEIQASANAGLRLVAEEKERYRQRHT